MIPIRDTTPSRTVPVVTYAIMGVNTLVFLVQMGLAPDAANLFVYRYGLVPAKYTVPEVSAWFPLSNLVFSTGSYMFLHGGFWHFIGNMWFLYIFGDNVEDHLGSPRFLGFYFLSGFASALLHFMINPVSTVPTVGASGAIAGVMGAYLILYPRSKILTLIPIIFIPWFVEIPAFLFLGFWFMMQFFNAAGNGSSAIAWWAHVGGFVAGIVMVKLSPRLPQSGAGIKLKKMTARKGTPKLQVIHARPVGHTPDLTGKIEISSLEALTGTRKIVNIPWGFYKRLYRVKVPSGVRQGTRLRLAGMGRGPSSENRGDMYLSVVIKNAI
ncbi:MAG: rhomboid family intramembrane serine protease [Desulfobacteraceae bacterium]|nr:rhomboid family intramembrane serine protease [Desulfobacteraceae bacterium]